jgi:hypothetical protein
MDDRAVRHRFLSGLATGLRVVWPILSALLVVIVGLGVIVGMREGWSVPESIYFAFVSGLTIGYGDLAPKELLSRVLSVCIGALGILVTALLAAIAVKALNAAQGRGDD